MPKQSPGDPRKFAIGDKAHAAQGDCDGNYGDADGENIMGVWKDCTIISSSTAFPSRVISACSRRSVARTTASCSFRRDGFYLSDFPILPRTIGKFANG